MGEDNDSKEQKEEKSDRTVVVRDKETGEPVEDAEVHIHPTDTDEDDEE